MLVTTEASRIGSIRFFEKPNSSLEWEMASNPTNAQGPITRMPKIPFRGVEAGENEGCGVFATPPRPRRTAKKQTSTPTQKRSMATVSTRPARRLLRQSRPNTSIAITESRASPI